jgi:hypothetical protein
MCEDTHIIITVPHALCHSYHFHERHCDRVAARAAQRLAQILSADQMRVRLFLSDRLRSRQVDYNRAESRSLAWRRLIDDAIVKEVPREATLFLFDVHSFPAETAERPQEWMYLVVPERPEDVVLAKHLYMHLLAALGNERMGMYRGSRINDIVLRAAELEVDGAFLLEFNENLNDAQMDTLCHLIQQWLLTLVGVCR